MDEEVRGRRKEGEKRETAIVEKKSTETERECKRERKRKKKTEESGGKVCHALSRGRYCPHGAVDFSLTHL